MSHTVRITRRITTTTTVRSGSVMGVNGDYLKTIPGLLALVEWVFGVIVLGLCAASAGTASTYVCFNNRELFLLIISVTFFITTFLMFISSLFHPTTAEALPTTLFELLYHCFAFLMYLAGTITVMVAIHAETYGSRYTLLLVAGIFAAFNTVLYLVSIVFSYKGYKKTASE